MNEKDETPTGRAEVEAALIEAAIDAVVEDGPRASVRDIAQRARVNHGLVHAYFGSKRALLSAALDEINRRTFAEVTDNGYPPADVASRRGGELAKAVARMRFDDGANLFSSHPVTATWREALRRDRPDLDDHTVDGMVAIATALGLGWAVFGDHLSEALGMSAARRHVVEHELHRLIAEIGGIPLDDNTPR